MGDKARNNKQLRNISESNQCLVACQLYFIKPIKYSHLLACQRHLLNKLAVFSHHFIFPAIFMEINGTVYSFDIIIILWSYFNYFNVAAIKYSYYFRELIHMGTYHHESNIQCRIGYIHMVFPWRGGGGVGQLLTTPLPRRSYCSALKVSTTEHKTIKFLDVHI